MNWRGFMRGDKMYAAVFVANGAQHVRKGETEAAHGPGCANFHLLFLTPGCKNYVWQLVIQGLNTEQIRRSKFDESHLSSNSNWCA
jgi:hypothetical protein